VSKTAFRGLAPSSIDLEGDTLLKPSVKESDIDFQKRMETASGTIEWLHRSRIVTGELTNSRHKAILNAQLSKSAYSRLRRPEEIVGNTPLGQAAAASVATSHDEEAIARLVVGCLS
jgi:hypothetical protein